jgi:hypothetical protein
MYWTCNLRCQLRPSVNESCRPIITIYLLHSSRLLGGNHPCSANPLSMDKMPPLRADLVKTPPLRIRAVYPAVSGGRFRHGRKDGQRDSWSRSSFSESGDQSKYQQAPPAMARKDLILEVAVYGSWFVLGAFSLPAGFKQLHCCRSSSV